MFLHPLVSDGLLGLLLILWLGRRLARCHTLYLLALEFALREHITE